MISNYIITNNKKLILSASVDMAVTREHSDGSL